MNNLQYFCERYTTLNAKNEQLDFVFDSSNDGRVLMKGMYIIMDFDLIERFFLDILTTLEKDLIYFEIHVFNYQFRLQEQSFINSSSIRMKESISDFLV